MDYSFISSLLQGALDIWSDNLELMYELLTTSPESFRSGEIYSHIRTLAGSLQGVAYALFTLFFLAGIIRQFSSFSELMRKEAAVKILLRFALGKILIDLGAELMSAIISIGQGIISVAIKGGGVSASKLLLPEEISAAVDKLGFLQSIPVFVIAILCAIVVWVLSMKMILTVYGRFFRIYLYLALAPVFLSSVSGYGTQRYALNFLRSFAMVAVEGIVMAVSMVVFSYFAVSVPDSAPDTTAFMLVVKYMGAYIFNMLILNTFISSSDRIVREMAM